MIEGVFDRGVPYGQWTAYTPDGELAHYGPWDDALAAALPPEVAEFVELGLTEIDEMELVFEAHDPVSERTRRVA